MTKSGHKNRFATIAVLVAIFIVFELYLVAVQTVNWRGFFFSTLHVLVVLLGSFAAIRVGRP